ncbi:hypothetical protein [Nocardia stercoris]|uniref:hypothetical protein n=1 Tax=Nocardia stercoris TaxID=2483361 RepID=UPI00389949E7
MSGLLGHWYTRVRPRANSAEAAILDHLLGTPILNSNSAQTLTGTSEVSTLRALNNLTEAGILEVLSANKRNRVWGAVDVLAELDELNAAIGRRTLG